MSTELVQIDTPLPQVETPGGGKFRPAQTPGRAGSERFSPITWINPFKTAAKPAQAFGNPALFPT
jgi:hypothetical protein